MSESNIHHRGGGDVCPTSLAGMLSTPLRRLLHDPQKLFAGLVSEGQTAADLGCGPGYFTLGLARLVGESGKVYAVDLQPGMLEIVSSRAERAGLLRRIRLHPCAANRIGLTEPVDFALAFWMVHEVPDAASFLQEVYSLVKPGGRFLLVEPRIHVSDEAFKSAVARAQAAGFRPLEERKVRISRAMLFGVD